MQASELERLVAPVTETAERAGAAILGVREEGVEVETKEDSSPVTRADQAAHEIIVEGLNRVRVEGEQLPLLSEEGKQESFETRRAWKRYWLIDPLDGTKDFINGRPDFTVNIALIEEQVPVFGVVHVPMRGATYVGMVDIGAFRAKNGVFAGGSAAGERLPLERRRQPASIGPESPLRVIATKSHMNEATQAFLSDLKSRYDDVEIVQAGSSFKFCRVAEGSADVYPRLGPTMEWDTAAGQAVAMAAGAVVHMLTGKPLRYNREDMKNPHFVVADTQY
jgi:3'(2'), 5'-bisphosphate nucleotidase